MTLAVMTGVEPDVWVDWGPRAMATAFEILDQMHGR